MNQQKPTMSSLDLSKVKSIHLRIQQIVFGYFRECKHTVFDDDESVIIPTIIIHICLLFYYEYDRWECMGDDLVIDENNADIVRFKDGHPDYSYNSAFLSQVCDSEKGGIYHWKFKLISMVYVWNIIGVWRVNDNELPPRNTYFTNGGITAYGLCLTDGELVNRTTGGGTIGPPYACAVKEDDIIEMYLDFDKMELRYTINNKEYGKAFDIEKSKYRAAICLEGDIDENGSVQLLY